MNILALNIGENIGWAVYSAQKAKKISHGRFILRKDKSETKEEPYHRFGSLLKKVATDNNVERVYYQEAPDEASDLYYLCLKEIEQYTLNCQEISSKQAISEALGDRMNDKNILISSMSNIGHTPEDNGEATAIIMAYYASKDI